MKVTCPICGEPGYLTRYTVYGRYYMRVEHIKRVDGKNIKRVCYLGKDTSELRRQLEQVIGTNGARKPVRLPGGDYSIADILQPRIEGLCIRPKCTFVEVFGGSGYMSQMVSRGVFGNIIYNDIDSLLVTLYKYIKEHPERLGMLLALMPYSRAYHKIVRDILRVNRDFASLVAAALVFYGVNTSFLGGLAKKRLRL